MGNRGTLHDAHRHLQRARWRHPHWIICSLTSDRPPRVPMTPGRYTELFFLDEAVALAAGHRPCAACRRADFTRFAEAWSRGAPGSTAPSAAAMDRILHAARLDGGGRQRTCERPWRDLPDGAFVADDGAAWLLSGPRMLRWSPAGYRAVRRRPVEGTATVLTPHPTLDALKAGYKPIIHPSAQNPTEAP